MLSHFLVRCYSQKDCACTGSSTGGLAASSIVATLSGPARDLLTSERTILNILGRLSGVATLTQQDVEAIADTKARIYDTRKTTPLLRVLERYAVRIRGGKNHRFNLTGHVLIKDNHIALAGGG